MSGKEDHCLTSSPSTSRANEGVVDRQTRAIYTCLQNLPFCSILFVYSSTIYPQHDPAYSRIRCTRLQTSYRTREAAKVNGPVSAMTWSSSIGTRQDGYLNIKPIPSRGCSGCGPRSTRRTRSCRQATNPVGDVSFSPFLHSRNLFSRSRITLLPRLARPSYLLLHDDSYRYTPHTGEKQG